MDIFKQKNKANIEQTTYARFNSVLLNHLHVPSNLSFKQLCGTSKMQLEPYFGGEVTREEHMM